MSECADVVIVTTYFPPEPGTRARRLHERVRYLLREGFRVKVVAPDRGMDSSAEKWTKDNLEVVRIRPWFPGVLPSMDYRWSRAKIPRSLKPFLGYIRWLIPCLRYLRRHQHNNAVLYTMNNPLVVHLIGMLAQRKFKSWIAELRDPITKNEYSHRWVFAVFDWVIERMVVRYADRVCTLAGALGADAGEMKQKYPQQAGKIVELPHLGASLSDFEDFHTPTRSGFVDWPLKGIFAGTFYTSPQVLMDAVEAYNQGGHTIVIDYFAANVERYILQPGNVYRGFVPYNELLLEYRQCNFAVLFDLVRTDDKGVFIPSKLYELIAIQKPILIIGRRTSPSAQIVKEHGIGVVAEDSKAEIVNGLDQIREMVTSGSFNSQYYETVKDQISNEASERAFLCVVKEVSIF